MFSNHRPIIMSAPMVRALLDGRKTQTRRLALTACKSCAGSGPRQAGIPCRTCDGRGERPTVWQKAHPGDRLWVRETWRLKHFGPNITLAYALKRCDEQGIPKEIVYEADDPGGIGSYRNNRPSIHMPRWASRLTLVVTEVRRQRLQEISADDCLAEGIEDSGPDMGVYRQHRGHNPEAARRYATGLRKRYAALWTSLHGAGAWDENPEVVALTFTVHLANIDRLEEAA